MVDTKFSFKTQTKTSIYSLVWFAKPIPNDYKLDGN